MTADQVAQILADPAVRAILARFPGAVIVAVRTPPAADHRQR